MHNLNAAVEYFCKQKSVWQNEEIIYEELDRPIGENSTGGSRSMLIMISQDWREGQYSQRAETQ